MCTLIAVAACGAGGPVVTMAEYEQVNSGMSYSEVKTIIGSPGVEQGNSYMEGVPGVMPSMRIVSYAWINSDGSNMIAMFQDDRLTNKAQAGLP